MPTINVKFDNSEFQRLTAAKGGTSWARFILRLAEPEQKTEPAPETDFERNKRASEEAFKNKTNKDLVDQINTLKKQYRILRHQGVKYDDPELAAIRDKMIDLKKQML